MNGIIHPCTSGLKGKKPTSEAEMFDNIFEYVDYLIKILRPKWLIYFAVDGVAPRAKMNQQRAWWFWGAQEIEEKNIREEKLKTEYIQKGF